MCVRIQELKYKMFDLKPHNFEKTSCPYSPSGLVLSAVSSTLAPVRKETKQAHNPRNRSGHYYGIKARRKRHNSASAAEVFQAAACLHRVCHYGV